MGLRILPWEVAVKLRVLWKGMPYLLSFMSFNSLGKSGCNSYYHCYHLKTSGWGPCLRWAQRNARCRQDMCFIRKYLHARSSDTHLLQQAQMAKEATVVAAITSGINTQHCCFCCKTLSLPLPSMSLVFIHHGPLNLWIFMLLSLLVYMWLDSPARLCVQEGRPWSGGHSPQPTVLKVPHFCRTHKGPSGRTYIWIHGDLNWWSLELRESNIGL